MSSYVFLQDKAAAAATPAKSDTKQETSKRSPSESKVSPGNKRPSAGGKSKGGSGGKRAKKAEVKEEETAKGPGGQRPKNSKRRSVASKVSYKEDSDSDGEQLSDKEFEAKSEEEEDSTDSESEAKSRKQKTGKARGKQKGTVEKKRSSSGDKKSAQDEDQEGEEDDDFEEDRGATRGGKAKPRNSKKREGPGLDEWLEVYLEKTSSWVCVDVEHGVAVPQLCSRNATAPMTYVVSVDGDGFVKDLGRKYDPTWMTSSRKRRVDEEWWEETLEPFQGPEDERDRKEDKEVKQH